MRPEPLDILMIHGAFCGAWAFDDFRMPFERAGHRVRALDLPGHGEAAEQPVSGLSMNDYAQVTAKAVEACAAPPVLVGHSLGGLVAAMAALKVDVRGVILLAPSAPWGIMGTSLEEAGAAVGLYGLGAYWAQAVAPDFALAGRYSFSRLPPDARRTAFDRMVPESGRAMWETLNWWLDPMRTTAVGKLEAPALAIAGGLDRLHPPATVRQTAQALGAAFAQFPQISHWLVGEPGWEDVAAYCLAWIDEGLRRAA